jgi:hypothetical protein
VLWSPATATEAAYECFPIRIYLCLYVCVHTYIYYSSFLPVTARCIVQEVHQSRKEKAKLKKKKKISHRADVCEYHMVVLPLHPLPHGT